jgi:hypothetical protein
MQIHVFPCSALDRAKLSFCGCVGSYSGETAEEFPSDSTFIILQINNCAKYTES